MKNNICYLKLYLNNNLGDDLFAKIISEKYPNTKFVVVSYMNKRSNFKNIKVITGTMFRIVNKLLKVITNQKVTIEKILAKRYQTAIVLGGSMFIEGKSDNYEELLLSKKYYILGSNFGPYKTQEYLDYCTKIFQKSEYTCFRDENSYNLLKNMDKDNITVAPDIVFGLDTTNVNITNRKRAIISIIDCKRKISEEYEKDYEEKIIELTKFLIKKGYEVLYMSFCKGENDEIAIQKILNKLDLKTRKSVDTYYYNGNIEEALNVLGDSSIIVGSRFHANILGLVLNKTIIPIIYSDKTSNMLEDINFNGKTIDIRRINEFNISSITEKDLEYKLDVSEEKIKSNIHFKELDKVLKKYNNGEG